MKKTALYGLLVMLLAFSFIGCDTDNGNSNGNDEFTVSFNTDGGSTAPNSVKIEDGKNIGTLPQTPTNGLWIFDGWYTGKNGSGSKLTSDTIITGNVTFYAKWISIFEGTWKLDGKVNGEDYFMIFTGNIMHIKNGDIDWQKSNFDYSSTKISATVIEVFEGIDGFTIGQEMEVEYTLISNVLCLPEQSQEFNKI